MYNLIFIIGRAVFWEINNWLVTLWLCLDYTSDVIYVIDSIIRFHEGKNIFMSNKLEIG